MYMSPIYIGMPVRVLNDSDLDYSGYGIIHCTRDASKNEKSIWPSTVQSLRHVLPCACVFCTKRV